MGSFYSADHIAEDHIHTDITCNIEEPRQKRRLGTEVINCVGEGEGVHLVRIRNKVNMQGLYFNSPVRKYAELLLSTWPRGYKTFSA